MKLSKFYNYIVFVFILAAFQAQGCNNTEKKVITTNAFVQDSIPVSFQDMKKIYPYFSKLFKGKVDNRDFTLYLSKVIGNEVLYSGYYYFDDDTKPSFVEGYESIEVAEAELANISSIESEAKYKSSKFLFSILLLEDVQKTFEVDDKRQGIRGWVTADGNFKGFLSQTGLKNSLHTASLMDGFDTESSVPVNLKEVVISKVTDEHKSISFEYNAGQTGNSTGIITCNIGILSQSADVQSNILKAVFQNGVSPQNSFEKAVRIKAKAIFESDTSFFMNEFQKCSSKYDLQINVDVSQVFGSKLFSSFICKQQAGFKNRKVKFQGLTYNEKSKKILTFEDVFNDDVETELLMKIKQQTRKLAKDDDEIYEKLNKSIDIKNFLVIDGGITFLLASNNVINSTHPILITVAYSDIKTIVKKYLLETE